MNVEDMREILKFLCVFAFYLSKDTSVSFSWHVKTLKPKSEDLIKINNKSYYHENFTYSVWRHFNKPSYFFASIIL